MKTQSFVRATRDAIGETQEVFAERLGVGLRSLKRYELNGTEPRSMAVRRQVEAVAKIFSMTRDPATWRYSTLAKDERSTSAQPEANQ